MLGFAAIPAVLQLIGFAVLPESPRWLVSKGRMEEARTSLQRIRGNVDIDFEIHEIERSCDEEKEGTVQQTTCLLQLFNFDINNFIVV